MNMVDLFGDQVMPEQHGSKLGGDWDYPPFSVWNAREGWWQDRKRAWLSLGIKSELGRGGGATWGDSAEITSKGLNHYRDKARTFGQDLMRGEHVVGANNPKDFRKGDFQGGSPDTVRDAGFYSRKRNLETELGREVSVDEFRTIDPATEENTASGTSIFDPVVCELAYRWFCPPGGQIIDPFAGGSVRGIVASHLGRKYVGTELRREQVEANWLQLPTALDPKPDWRNADSRDIALVCFDVQADMVFSCPPYADLEVYSDDPADLSTLSYDAFLEAYRHIVKETCSLLKDNRFACFVVGDVRDKKGNYRNFTGDTVEAFRSAGLHFYNEAILVTAVGSLPVRVGKQFAAGRKLGKTHQNVLVFVKGDGKKATQAMQS